MKLYLVPRNTYIKIEGDAIEQIFKFDHIDGMLSICYTEDGELCHLSPSTEVIILD